MQSLSIVPNTSVPTFVETFSRDFLHSETQIMWSAQMMEPAGRYVTAIDVIN